MNDRPQLERRYRRLLACYPRGFRREHEEEMLVVLLACARDGRRMPGAFDTVNLIWNAVRIRLAPAVPRSLRSVVWGVRLTLVVAFLEMVALVVVIVSRGAVDAAVSRHIASAAVVHRTALVQAELVRIEVGAPIAAAAWLVLARANARGRRWGRGAMVALSILTAISLLAAVADHAASYAPADLIVGIVLCATAAAATALIITAHSDSHYGPRKRDPSRSGPSRPMARISQAASDPLSWN